MAARFFEWTIRTPNPSSFWEWLIREIQLDQPEVLFLAEGFTRPKMMRVLAKAGFTQSYTYFTWRNSKEEMTEYLTELTRTQLLSGIHLRLGHPRKSLAEIHPKKAQMPVR